jgi:uncharacterized protein YndB with AHSA1/START domain
MFAEQIRKWWHATPFTPFNLVLPAGERIHVPHPDFLTVSPGGRIAQIWKDGEDYTQVDVFLVTAVESAPKRTKHRREKRARRKR